MEQLTNKYDRVCFFSLHPTTEERERIIFPVSVWLWNVVSYFPGKTIISTVRQTALKKLFRTNRNKEGNGT
jgi:hypothetical protein